LLAKYAYQNVSGRIRGGRIRIGQAAIAGDAARAAGARKPSTVRDIPASTAS
jgi:hypothetical protein